MSPLCDSAGGEQQARSGDVAIIGMACVFPKAPNLQAFWENILAKVNAISDPPAEWGSDLVHDPASSENDRLYMKKGAYLGELARFDPLDYGVMPHSVDGGEPEHFLALRLAHDALGDAGYLERPFNRERTAVILGRGTYINRGYMTILQHTVVVDQTIRLLRQLHPEYSPERLQELKKGLKASLPPFNAETAPGLAHSVMCGRIANRLDLMGPAYTVDAACASSLIAVELGMRDLASGSADLVLAGGIQISTTIPIAILFAQLGALSRSGKIRPFDPEADGTLLGEGAGILVLKRRSDAERDGDRIYALVKAVGSASDGRALGVLAPRAEGEELAMRRAYERCGISPRSVGLIEAHGTGTPVGDATEMEALSRVFGVRENCVPSCAIGSVKSMIGHCIPAAGVAGLIKAALALYHKVLPPTLHAAPQPKFASTPFYLNSQTRPWIQGGPEPRRVGVSAFGFGGINAHSVLEEHHSTQSLPNVHVQRDSEVFFLADSSRDGLVTRCQGLQTFLGNNPDVSLPDLAYALNCPTPRQADVRVAIVASSYEDLVRKLDYAMGRLAESSCRRIKDRSGIYYFEERLGDGGQLAFLFPGEGAQYPNMLLDLCIHFPEVRAWFDLMDRAFQDHPRGFLPSQVIFPPPSLTEETDSRTAQQLWNMDSAIEAVFTANQALHSLLSRLGVRPQAIAGHSTGDYSALLAAGAIEIDNEAMLVEHVLRGNRVTESATRGGLIPKGALLAVGPADPDMLRTVIGRMNGSLFLAMDNCPHQMVLYGSREVIDRVQAEFRSQGLVCQPLQFSRAYHTPLYGAVCEELRGFFEGMKFVAPRIPLYSCATAATVPSGPEEVRRIAIEQWARPVRFRETVEAMYGAGIRIFVEVGPRGNLTAFVEDILRGCPHVAVASNLPKRSGMTQLHHVLGLLGAHGIDLTLDALYAERGGCKLPIDAIWKGVALPKKRQRSMKLSLGLPFLNLDKAFPPASPPSCKSFHVPVASSSATPPTPIPQGGRGEFKPSQERSGQSVSAFDKPPLTGHRLGGESKVMSEYFQTMECLLETQEEVMQAYLYRGRSNADQCRVSEFSLAAQVSTERLAVIHQGVALKQTVLTSPRVQNPHRDVEQPSGSAPVQTEELAPVAHEDPSSQRETIQRLVLEVVSEKTGYPIEMLNLTANLEADLGIDSIKRVEILGKLARECGCFHREAMEEAVRLKTLDQIVAFVAEGQIPGSFQKAEPSPETPHLPLPFVGKIVRQVDGEEIVAVRTLDLNTDIFLRDHALGPRISEADPALTPLPVLPLALSVEMMAQAASLLVPDLVVTMLKDVHAHRWIALRSPQLTLETCARRRVGATNEVEVQVREIAESSPRDGGRLLLLDGIVCFAEPTPAPRTAAFSLRGERTSFWKPEQLYAEGQRHGMFHGPTFQGVASLNRVGENGAEATLRAVSPSTLFRSTERVDFLTAPLLLDSVGQVLGFWTAERFERAFVVFPVGFQAMRIHCLTNSMAADATGRVQVTHVDESRVRADLEVLNHEGLVLLQVAGWEDRRFDLPDRFYAFRLNPGAELASVRWSEPLAGRQENERARCCRLEFPAGFLSADFGIWQEVLAHLVLSRKERETWRGLRGATERQTDWLLGRVAAKDAVRLWLKERYGLQLYPADIEIGAEENGQPRVGGAWTERLQARPAVSIALAAGLAVAIAGEAQEDARGGGVGIDIESLSHGGRGLSEGAFTEKERELLTGLDATVHGEWILRLWCCKQAAAKAIGCEPVSGPAALEVQEVVLSTGEIRLTVAGGLARQFPARASQSLTAWTLRQDDLIVAVSML